MIYYHRYCCDDDDNDNDDSMTTMMMMVMMVMMTMTAMMMMMIRSSKRVTELQRKLPGIQQKLTMVRGRDEQAIVLLLECLFQSLASQDEEKRSEKFNKEIPENLDNAWKRCRKVFDDDAFITMMMILMMMMMMIMMMKTVIMMMIQGDGHSGDLEETGKCSGAENSPWGTHWSSSSSSSSL